MKKTKIICVVGPTASGKTALGVEIAKAVGGEIISADSMQVYRDMPIATAVATADEQQGIPHHLTEFLDSTQQFSVADFVFRAKTLITDISHRGNVPIIVGGTGLFVDSLVKNIEFSEVGADTALREELNKMSCDDLYKRLCKADIKAAQNIHPNNKKRVIRAIELAEGGTTKTEQNNNSTVKPSPYDALYIGITYADRQNLYDRINTRVDSMLNNGLAEEAERMRRNTSSTSKQAIGHKELYPYFDGKISLDDAVENLKRETRRYAKRQLTWFRRNDSITWLCADEMSRSELNEKAIALAKNFLK